MRGVVAALVAVTVVACAATAVAKDKNKAREAYRTGTQHYNLGEFQPALDAFKEAYRNYEDATFLFNIAQCQRQLGLKQEAVYSYKTYLREAASAPNREEVMQLIASLE